jgi:uncharacterized integral membrane protein
MVIALILALLFAILAVIFAVQNTAPVAVVFFSWQIEGSLALVVLIALAVGVLIGMLVLTPSVVKRSLSLSGQRKKIAGLEKDLDDHKTRLSEAEKKAELAKPETEKPE